nr:MAG TPA: hypothetical protein [Caudoviricetes sp.]
MGYFSGLNIPIYFVLCLLIIIFDIYCLANPLLFTSSML